MSQWNPRLTPQEQYAVGLFDRMMATPNGRRMLVVLAVCGLLALACYGIWLSRHGGLPSGPHGAAGPTVRVATWNMHVFAPRPAIDLGRIAQIIKENHFDVVALQEVRDAGAEVDALLNALGPPWHGTRVSDETGNHEYFEFIYDADHVQEVGSAHTVASASVTTFNRWPYQATFQSGPFRFTLITVHLYYGRAEAGSRKIEPQELQKRQAEAEALARIAASIEAGSEVKHVIVLGDFNEQHAHGFLHYFEDQGWKRLVSDPTNLSSSEIFDNILIDPKETTEWTGRSGAVHYDETYYPGDRRKAVESVSDHRPAWADFYTGVGSAGPSQSAPPAAPARSPAPGNEW